MIVGLFILAFMSRRQESMVILIALIPISNMIVQIFDKYDKDGTKDFMKLNVKSTRSNDNIRFNNTNGSITCKTQN